MANKEKKKKVKNSGDEDEELLKRQKKALKALCLTVKDIFQTYTTKFEGGGRSTTKGKDILKEQTARYADSLDHAGFKFEFHKKYYLEIYNEHKIEILESSSTCGWLSNNLITLHLGHDIKAAAVKKIILKLSIAYLRANEIRIELDKELGDNPNKNAAIKSKYDYQFADELVLNLLKVFVLCLDSEHRDVKRLNKEIKVFEERLEEAKESTEDSSDEASGTTGGFFNNIAGKLGGGKMEKGEMRQAADMFSGMLGNESLIDKINAGVERVQKDSEGNGKMNSAGDIFKTLATVVADLGNDFPDMDEMVGNPTDKKEKKDKKDKKG